MGRYSFNLGCAFLCLLQFGYGEILIPKASENTAVHQCIMSILNRDEVLNATGHGVTLVNVNESLIKELHTLLEHPLTFVTRPFYWPNNTAYNNVYVIHCKTYSMFAEGMDLVKRDAFWNPRAKFIIIVEYIEDVLKEISEFLVPNLIYDVALIADDHRNIVVYSFGLEHDECDRPIFKILQLLSPCSENDNIDQIYVGKRKSNLRGCHVKFITQYEFWPFIDLETNNSIEQYLLKLVHEYENISVELVPSENYEDYGNRLENFTYTGMLHQLEIYNVEGVIGGYILNLNQLLSLDFIYPYIIDHHIIVLAEAKLLGQWSGVLKQLGVLNVWSMFATFGFACATVVFMKIFQTRLRDTSRDILIVWGYFLGNISQLNPKVKVAFRLVILSILIYVFVESCAAQASLSSVITHPIRDYQPNQKDEVVSNYELILSPSQYIYLNNNGGLNVTNALVTCRNASVCMYDVMANPYKRLFTVSSELLYQKLNWVNDGNDLKVLKIKEPVLTLIHTTYIRRGSSLAEPFNRVLSRAHAAGLIRKFIEKLIFSQRTARFKSESSRKPQKLEGLRGVFMVLFLGYGISLICILIEYFRNRFHNTNRSPVVKIATE